MLARDPLAEAPVCRLGVAVLGLGWILLAMLQVAGITGASSGATRADVVFFQHGALVNWTFVALAGLLFVAAILFSAKYVAALLAAWLGLQLIHLGYHLYDIEIVRPELRAPVFGVFALKLVAAAIFLLFLTRTSRRARVELDLEESRLA